MNELINIEVQNNTQVVSARNLYEKLSLSERFSKWWDRILKYGFEIDKDYTPYQMVHPQNNQEISDYFITLSMAKEICMIQRNDIGRQLRQYFIKCEEAWNSPEMVLARANQIQAKMIEDFSNRIKELENTVEEQKPKVELAETLMVADGLVDMGEMAKLLKPLCDVGRNTLFDILRGMKILDKKNIPYQRYMTSKWFEIKDVVIDGKVYVKTYITPKGQEKIFNLFREV